MGSQKDGIPSGTSSRPWLMAGTMLLPQTSAAMDRPTDRPAAAERYTQLHLVGDVVGLLDALGEETACVTGHDWGAIITWSAALRRPDRVRAVMAMSVPYTPRGSVSSLAAGRAAFGDGFYHNYFQQPGLAEAEFERDCRTTLRKFLYGASGECLRANG
ncbi:MAG: alpha/beta fold hydrolase [Ktedonobacteraceae bacterium]